MKRFTTLALAAITLAGSALWIANEKSVAQSGSTEAAKMQRDLSKAYLHSYNLPSSGLALEGYCPVAYFAVNKPVMGKPEYTSTHQGVTYQFVSADAKAAFDKQPGKYIPAYGGWCAFGMAVEDKFPVDPRSFKIVDGKLLLFLKNKNVDALELWNQGNQKEHLKKAERHWNKVSG